MSWLVYSPDLNSIKIYWNWIKDYIEDKWSLKENPSYDKLRSYVKEAWDTLPKSFLADLFTSIPVRC